MPMIFPMKQYLMSLPLERQQQTHTSENIPLEMCCMRLKCVISYTHQKVTVSILPEMVFTVLLAFCLHKGRDQQLATFERQGYRNIASLL
ncbi:uncharacterized protein LOC100249813 [Vitis vinifera]|uniref:uncharacterized protein LOC100249813 n=1 Tax=Vitis vinifera TaxID=29760 RepID=UPI002882E1C8|nr:uncharacterized protein LOC100249813 [Vitis vinifera]